MRRDESKVLMLLDSDERKLMRITKESLQDRGFYSCYVMLDGCHVLIQTKDIISYVWHSKSKSKCRKKFYYLAGKMMRKSVVSKYFKNPMNHEHCSNGKPDGIYRSVWEDVAKTFYPCFIDEKNEEETKK